MALRGPPISPFATPCRQDAEAAAHSTELPSTSELGVLASRFGHQTCVHTPFSSSASGCQCSQSPPPPLASAFLCDQSNQNESDRHIHRSNPSLSLQVLAAPCRILAQTPKIPNPRIKAHLAPSPSSLASATCLSLSCVNSRAWRGKYAAKSAPNETGVSIKGHSSSQLPMQHHCVWRVISAHVRVSMWCVHFIVTCFSISPSMHHKP